MKTFKKKIPSVFVVETPLQAIFAVQAIRDFQIDQYLVLVWQTVRFTQVSSVLNHYGIVFHTEDMELITVKREWFSALFHRSIYKRAFIGFPKMHMLFCACRYLDYDSTILLLDDGIATVTLFKNGKLLDLDKWFIKPFHWLTLLKRITYNKHIYTIFDDLSHNGFFIYPNSMSLLSNNKGNVKTNEIYLIGTDPLAFSKSIGVELAAFYEIQKNIMLEIRKRTSSSTLYFIPHGSDINITSKIICEETGWQYQKVDMTIEMLILKKAVLPEAVYGFLSTALFVLKKMFAEMNVVSIYPHFKCNSDQSDNYMYLSRYYGKHGILSVDRQLNVIEL